MLGALVSGLAGYGLCKVASQPRLSGSVGAWSWQWTRDPVAHEGRPIGTVRLSRSEPPAELTPPTRVFPENAEGYALGFLSGANEL